MRMRVLIFVALIIWAAVTSGTAINAYPASKVSTRSLTQQTADFNVTINYPAAVGAGEIFQISVEVHLKVTAAATSDISINMTLDVGLAFNGSEDPSRDMGDFAPGDTKVENYTVTASRESAFPLVRVFLYQDGEQQFVETIDGPLNAYAVIGVTVKLPRLIIKGPLELKGVVPRLRLRHKEIGILTYNVSSEGQAAVFGLSFSVESPKSFEILSISPASLDRLEPDDSILVVVTGRCTVDSASLEILRFTIQSSSLEDVLEKVVKVETFDWFNLYKYDNKWTLIAWPLAISFLLILGASMTVYYWKKRNERNRIKKKLEEQYGKGLEIPD